MKRLARKAQPIDAEPRQQLLEQAKNRRVHVHVLMGIGVRGFKAVVARDGELGFEFAANLPQQGAAALALERGQNEPVRG